MKADLLLHIGTMMLLHTLLVTGCASVPTKPTQNVYGIRMVDLPNDTPIGSKDLTLSARVGGYVSASVGIQNARDWHRTLLAPDEIRVYLILEDAAGDAHPIPEELSNRQSNRVLTADYTPWETKWRTARVRVPFRPRSRAYLYCYVPASHNLDKAWSSWRTGAIDIQEINFAEERETSRRNAGNADGESAPSELETVIPRVEKQMGK